MIERMEADVAAAPLTHTSTLSEVRPELFETFKPTIVFGTGKWGYGHDRGVLAVTHALERIMDQYENGREALAYEVINISDPSYDSPAQKTATTFETLLNRAYAYAPAIMRAGSSLAGGGGMNMINTSMVKSDQGHFAESIPKSTKLIIAGHSVINQLAEQTSLPTISLTLDPYAELYHGTNPNATSVNPNVDTALELKQTSSGEQVVTGPIVPTEIADARERFETRSHDLLYGRTGIHIVIATGGSLTHGNEIVGLARAYIENMTKNQAARNAIDDVSIIVGDSSPEHQDPDSALVGALLGKSGYNMRDRIENMLRDAPEYVRRKVHIISDPDDFSLIAKADEALGMADVIHAKTGELVYAVGGGKAFETFGHNPSLAAQEIALRKYVESLTGNPDTGDCALEQGDKNYDREVNKIVQQYQDKTIVSRMALGLKVPTNGAEYTAHMIAQKLGLKRIEPKNIEKSKQQEQLQLVEYLLTNGYKEAYERKEELKQALLELSGFQTLEEFLEAVKNDTAIITFLAGSGSRWKKSLEETQSQTIDPEKPRALARVKNLLTDADTEQTIPIGRYALRATAGIGQHIIVHHGYEDEIKQSVTEPLGMQSPIFFKQQYDNNGKALGHGDALLQMKNLIKNKKYILTQGGTDPNARDTVILSLLTLYVHDKFNTPLALVIPSANMENPPYPIRLDDNFMPSDFGHAKLKGTEQVKRGVSNIGIRAYRTQDLLKYFDHFKRMNGRYDDIYGHVHVTSELTLDDFDSALLLTHRVRQLALARPQEILGAIKTVHDIPRFLTSMRKILNTD